MSKPTLSTPVLTVAGIIQKARDLHEDIKTVQKQPWRLIGRIEALEEIMDAALFGDTELTEQEEEMLLVASGMLCAEREALEKDLPNS